MSSSPLGCNFVTSLIILASTLLPTGPHSGSVNKVCAQNEYIVGFEQAVENNRFSKYLISKKTMQFQEN